MGEIVTIGLGGGGIRMADAFLRTIAAEHGLDERGRMDESSLGSEGGSTGHGRSQIERVGSFLRKSPVGYAARAVFADFDPSGLMPLESPRSHGFYDISYSIRGREGTGGNWAKGRRFGEVDLIDELKDAVSTSVGEANDHEGFIIFHAAGGGTGSALSSLIIPWMREQYPERIIAAVTMWPSQAECEGVAAYNAVLGSRGLVEDVDLCFLVQYDKLHEVCSQGLKIPNPTYQDFNRLIANAVANVTAGSRFPGGGSGFSSMRDIVEELAPSARLHFLSLGLSAAPAGGSSSIPDMAREIFAAPNNLSADPTGGKYLSARVVFRGPTPPPDVDRAMQSVREAQLGNFLDAAPDRLKWGVYGEGAVGAPTSATLVANTSAIRATLDKTHKKFVFLRRLARFSSDFKSNGLTGEDMDELGHYLRVLIGEYEEG